MVDQRWWEREQLILEAIAEAQERGDDPAGAARDAVAELDGRRYAHAIAELEAAGYIRAMVHTNGAGEYYVAVPQGLTERGLRATRAWPSTDPYEALLAALDNAEGATDDPQRKSKIRALRDAIVGTGKDVVSNVVANLLTGGLPG